MGASIAISDRPNVKPASAASRIPAFDFTKGALVLFMVLYHWLNYFYGVEGDVYKYLRFLTPSFIFITGFLISYVHLSKYGVGNPQLAKRLFWRGLKLLVVFVVLNLLITLVLPNSSARSMFFGRSGANLFAIFVSGNVYVDRTSKAAAFTILVPIGYLLMVSAVLSLVCRFFKYSFHVACGLLMLAVFLLGMQGIHSVILELLAIGLLGVVCGYATKEEMQKVVSHPLVAVVAYVAYLGAVTAWDAPFPLRIVGVLLTLILIYMAGSGSGEPGRLRRRLILLGKNSLFGYISQIAILQALRRGLGHTGLGMGVLIASFIAGFALTMFSVEAVDWLRPKSAAFDWCYRAVFA